MRPNRECQKTSSNSSVETKPNSFNFVYDKQINFYHEYGLNFDVLDKKVSSFQKYIIGTFLSIFR